MHDIRDIRANPEKYKTGLRNRQDDPSLIDSLLAIAAEAVQARRAEDERLATRRQNSRRIGELMQELKALDREIEAADRRIAQIDSEQQALCEMFFEACEAQEPKNF